MSNQKQYAERDIMQLDEDGGYYFRHVDAMTGESLHSKSDIVAELGYRDQLIDTYRELCGELLKTLRITESWLEGWSSAESELAQTKLAITKAESILGEKND